MATIRLSSVKIGEKNIRFLYFRKPNQIYVTSIKSTEDVPLFLGGDVLAASAQSSKNFCRIHSRYAKDGLATRLTFKGLFTAAFEHLDIIAQRDCLIKLKDVWISKSYCKWVPQSDATVTLLLEDVETSLDVVPCKAVLAPAVVVNRESNCNKEADNTKDDNPGLLRNEAQDNISRQYDQLCNVKGTTQVQISVAGKSSKLCAGNDGSEYEGKSVLQVTQDLITNNYLDRECYLLLFEILNEYRSIISDSERLLNFDDDISVHLNVLLCVISNCLGHHFNSFKESIASKVEVFKTENINQIDNLPSAEDLVTLLFPQCMQVFMITWMSTHNRTLTCNSDFGPSPKKRKMQDAHQVKEVTDKNFDKCESQPTNVFPFIQLILEFANNVLISGVAHVLYSRLLHSS